MLGLPASVLPVAELSKFDFHRRETMMHGEYDIGLTSNRKLLSGEVEIIVYHEPAGVVYEVINMLISLI